MTGYGHTPVLLEETLFFLQASRPGVYLDGTFGLGGHSLEILTGMKPRYGQLPLSSRIMLSE